MSRGSGGGVVVAPGAVAGRRTPRQPRGRATVDALLDAADDLVAEGGVDGLTTSAVAERAGVAVGTLYQYFDGVDAVVAGLVGRHGERFADDLGRALADRTLHRKRDAANAALDLFIERCRARPAFRDLWRSRPGSGAVDADALVAVVTGALAERGLADADDPAFVREVEVQWAVAEALVGVAFRRHPAGDPAVLAHLRRLFDLDVEPV